MHIYIDIFLSNPVVLYSTPISFLIYTVDPHLPRASCDFGSNRFGDHLLDLCKSSNFRVVNGRLYGDKDIGKFTCMTYNGESVVDYLVTSQVNFQDLADFYVHDFNEFKFIHHISVNVSVEHNFEIFIRL